VLVIFEGIAEGLSPDKPQYNLIDQLTQIEYKRHRLDQSKTIAVVALLVMVF